MIDSNKDFQYGSPKSYKSIKDFITKNQTMAIFNWFFNNYQCFYVEISSLECLYKSISNHIPYNFIHEIDDFFNLKNKLFVSLDIYL